jgi:hypothetical protein
VATESGTRVGETFALRFVLILEAEDVKLGRDEFRVADVLRTRMGCGLSLEWTLNPGIHL